MHQSPDPNLDIPNNTKSINNNNHIKSDTRLVFVPYMILHKKSTQTWT